MKKIIIIFALFSLIFSVNSQIVVDSTDFALFGSFYYDASDTVSYNLIEVGTTGENTWDFTYFIEAEVDTLTFLDPEEVASVDSFPEANFIARIDSPDTTSAYIFLDFSSDALTMLGVIMSIDDTTVMLTNDPYELIMDFPATYDEGNEITYEYTSVMTFPISETHTILVNSFCKDTLVVDAWGTLDLPDYTDIPVIRDNNRTWQLDSTYIYDENDTTLLETDTTYKVSYTWFSNDERFKFRVLEIRFEYPDLENYSICDTTVSYVKYAEIITNINNSINTNVSIFPNPTNDIINISNIPENCINIQIISYDGKIVKNISPNSNQIVVSIKDLQSGIYLMKFEGTNISKKILIE